MYDQYKSANWATILTLHTLIDIDLGIYMYLDIVYSLFYHGHVIDPVAFKSSLAVVYWTIYHPQYTTPNRN